MDTRYFFPDEFAYVRLVPVPGGLPSDVPVNSIEDARQAVMGFMGELDREYFCVLSVNARNRPINFCVVAVGSATSSQVHFADSFKPALLSNAAKVAIRPGTRRPLRRTSRSPISWCSAAACLASRSPTISSSDLRCGKCRSSISRSGRAGRSRSLRRRQRSRCPRSPAVRRPERSEKKA